MTIFTLNLIRRHALTAKTICGASLLAMVLASCGKQQTAQSLNISDTVTTNYSSGSYGYDVQELRRYHPDLIELTDKEGKAKIVIVPGYQARVMTSTATGSEGQSFGWVNHKLIASGDTVPHMHPFGGEERFWLGPEGGQFSIYFKKGLPFTYENWQVPREIDTDRFSLTHATATDAQFEKEMHLENYSGNTFDLRVNRNIRLLTKEGIDSLLGLKIDPGMESVGFESENILTNTGTEAWTKQRGLLSIWILSMMNASDSTTVAIPYTTGDEKRLGNVVTDDYFGKVPADRLVVDNGLILFKADGNYRSKIGVAPGRARPVLGSYDATNQVLTLAMFTLPASGDYVNSKWELQKDPFSGDAVNSYNDGPVNGAQMGKWYEIESSSPAAALHPGESLTHFHRTIHLKGDEASLDKVSQKVLGVKIQDIRIK